MQFGPRHLMLACVLAAAACNNAGFKGSAAKLDPEVTREFTQDAYPDAQANLVQGFSGEPQSENFEQGQWGALDILVVIDNSGSMAEEQANLSGKLAPLLSKVDKADWQVKIVTTDPADGCSGPHSALVKKTDANFNQRFAAAINAGTSGTGVERPFLQAVNGLKCPAAPWVRPGSTVVVLIVTDEDNCHVDNNVGYNCDYDPKSPTGQGDWPASFLTGYLSSVRTLGKDAKIYGLYKIPGDTSCTTALATATLVDQAVKASGGHYGSICDADYGPTLTDISGDVAQILKYEFDLDNDPDQGTVKVSVDGADWTKFTLDGRTVHFTEPPPFGSKVEVAFTHGKDGSIKSDFPLDTAPVPASIKVEVNGQVAVQGSYTWDDTAKKLRFTAPPPEKATLKVTYQALVPLKDTFTVAAGADPKTIVVDIAGQQTTSFTYDAATGAVKITPAPPAGAKVKISYHLPR